VKMRAAGLSRPCVLPLHASAALACRSSMSRGLATHTVMPPPPPYPCPHSYTQGVQNKIPCNGKRIHQCYASFVCLTWLIRVIVRLTRTCSFFLSFLSWVANTQLNHWTKQQMVRIRLITGRAASLEPPRATRNQSEVILYFNFFPFSPPFFCNCQNPTTRRCHPMIIPGPRFRRLIQSSWPGALF